MALCTGVPRATLAAMSTRMNFTFTSEAARVTGPASGIESHTVEFWSLDNNLNTETPHKKATFTVADSSYDDDPPSGTMSVNNNAPHTNTTAATINSSVIDTGSGMGQMRIDPGSGTYGTPMPYAPSRAFTLQGGDGIKTVRVLYTDVVGNASVLTDTIRLDTIAPVTTSSVVSGMTYTGAQTFTLTPADAGSGVATTRWQLDSTAGTWTSGTSVPVAAPSSGATAHTLYWYSVDAAGNPESTKSVAFSVSAVSGTATLSFRWDPPGIYAQARLHVHDASGPSGTLIASTALDTDSTGMWWSLEVPSGQTYYMEVDWYQDVGEDWFDEGGPYGIWSNDPSINPDGLLSPGETIIWWY